MSKIYISSTWNVCLKFMWNKKLKGWFQQKPSDLLLNLSLLYSDFMNKRIFNFLSLVFLISKLFILKLCPFDLLWQKFVVRVTHQQQKHLSQSAKKSWSTSKVPGHRYWGSCSLLPRRQALFSHGAKDGGTKRDLVLCEASFTKA